MSLRKRFLYGLGCFYRALYRLPVIGEGLVKTITRTLGRVSFLSPVGPRPSSDIRAIREDLERLLGMIDVDFEVVYQDESRFEFILPICPYGFARREHEGVCEAAMDMDRVMFGLCGGGLVIEESIPTGAPACRISISARVAA